MSYRHSLADRWMTADGVRRRTNVLSALLASKDPNARQDWSDILTGFPGVEEIRGRNDLRGINLSHFDLGGVELTGLHLQHARLDGCILAGSSFHYSSLACASLVGAVATNAVMMLVDARFAVFDEAKLDGVDFTGAKFAGASFRSAALTGARFEGVDLSDAVLTGAQTEEATFCNVTVDRALLPERTWHQVAKSLHSWASHGKEVRVDVTGLPDEHSAVVHRALVEAGVSNVAIVGEGNNVFVRGSSTVR